MDNSFPPKKRKMFLHFQIGVKIGTVVPKVNK